MAMSIGGNHEDPMMEINTTPLIDVMLVLLIMLIITLPALTHAVKLDLPYGGTAQESDNIAVMIDFDGTVVWDGTVVATLPELERNMRAISRANPQPTISVRADRRAQYDAVAQVLATAQRNGLQRIAIEGSP